MNWLDKIKIRSWATPLCIGSFLIVGFSGVLMFIDVDLGMIKTAHEWIGLVLVAGVIAHMLLNQKMLLRYFSNPVAIAIICVIIITGGVMAIFEGDAEERAPSSKVSEMMRESTLAVVAQVVKTTPDLLKNKLQAQGMVITDTNQTINQIAQTNRKSPRIVMSLIFGDNQDLKENDPESDSD
jgi:hypothetical protein